MRKEFEGQVELGNEYRGWGSDLPGLIHIGGVDFLDVCDRAGLEGPVEVDINDGEKVIRGQPELDMGYCDKQYNPVKRDRFDVGGRDVLTVLQFYAGENVNVIVTEVDND